MGPVLQVFEECNPDSPYSFQFIDPTRHRPTYGAKRSNATAALCQASLRAAQHPACWRQGCAGWS
jgi:hypothetical protein